MTVAFNFSGYYLLTPRLLQSSEIVKHHTYRLPPRSNHSLIFTNISNVVYRNDFSLCVIHQSAKTDKKESLLATFECDDISVGSLG